MKESLQPEAASAKLSDDVRSFLQHSLSRFDFSVALFALYYTDRMDDFHRIQLSRELRPARKTAAWPRTLYPVNLWVTLLYFVPAQRYTYPQTFLPLNIVAH